MPEDNNGLHRIFRLIQNDATRKRSPEEEEAARRFVLGHGTVAEWIEARRKTSTR
jgi:hypothetical protein